jgi:hypothetical protein
MTRRVLSKVHGSAIYDNGNNNDFVTVSNCRMLKNQNLVVSELFYLSIAHPGQ